MSFFRSEIWSGSSNYIMKKKKLLEKVNSKKKNFGPPKCLKFSRKEQPLCYPNSFAQIYLTLVHLNPLTVIAVCVNRTIKNSPRVDSVFLAWQCFGSGTSNNQKTSFNKF